MRAGPYWVRQQSLSQTRKYRIFLPLNSSQIFFTQFIRTIVHLIKIYSVQTPSHINLHQVQQSSTLTLPTIKKMSYLASAPCSPQDLYLSAGTLSPRRLPSTLCSLTPPRDDEYSLPASTCFTPEGDRCITSQLSSFGSNHAPELRQPPRAAASTVPS